MISAAEVSSKLWTYPSSQKVHLALELDKCSIYHLVEMSPEDTFEWARLSTRYNGYDPHKAARMVKTIDALIPKMCFPGDNPNNGRTHHSYVVGAESSRVMHLSVRRFYLPSDFDMDSLLNALRHAAMAADADEYWETELTDSNLEFRIWWD